MTAYRVSVYYKEDIYLPSPQDVFFYLLNNHIAYEEIVKAYNWCQTSKKNDVYENHYVYIEIVRFSLKEKNWKNFQKTVYI